MRYIICLFCLCSFSACIISIDTNDHRSLKEGTLKHFVPFSEVSRFTVNDTNNLLVYEINPKDLKEAIRQNKFTWIHLWRPHCTAEACENINAPLNAARRNNVGFFLVATSYDFKNIRQSVIRTGYKGPICVLQNSWFKNADRNGGKSRSLKQFSKEMHNNPALNAKYVDDYFFKDTLLIYTGSPVYKNLLEGQRVDSLVNANR